ncbi:hypothetical protein KW795_01595 [Candidatus Microgenomates bacterium]|nr:hypothetical protein [Candidatus Microgenomates bacterium]
MAKFSTIGDVISRFEIDKDKYISVEFQKYGYDLAQELGDGDHVSLYIKLSKITPRGYIETARNFVKDARNVKSKPKLFMWKLKQIKDGEKKKKEGINAKP